MLRDLVFHNPLPRIAIPTPNISRYIGYAPTVPFNVVSVSDRAMLEALVEGTEDPRVLAAPAKGKLRAKQPALETGLQSLVGPHQRLLLASHLRHPDFLDAEIGQLDQKVAAHLKPFGRPWSGWMRSLA